MWTVPPALRSVGSLMEVADPAWPKVQDWLHEAEHPVEVLPVEPALGQRTLHRLQVTAHSVLGALAIHTGGLLVDHGCCESSAVAFRR